ncbi:LysM peptidoglycan-binding domain-containing protein [Brachybacterium kimchii]|uniref:LysM peptidoglycan-binding domain-containing protein n=1 Tax=Brachybacterium kimchii TaxID=2942909 RepID=A0ABY4NCY3_9MICO|nr:LysM peptidoglycan-binding domain-containing protein [Brachybacterium kimchii]UQN31766.1 LysM peptidoglycan-binding domain-containing protein [Brachybacterium kimchii]
MIKPVKALAALLVLIALIVGIPAGLLVFYGNPIPDSLPTGSDVTTLLTSSDTIGFFIFLLVWAGWIAWLTFVLSVIVEIIARARHLSAPQLPGFMRAQQGAAALLITAIAGGIGAPAALADTTPAEPAPVVQSVETEAPAMPTEQPSTDHQSTSHDSHGSNDLEITVRPGDTVWDLAQQHLGSGQRWKEIVDANAGRPQADGHTLEAGKADMLEPGWKLTIPGVPASQQHADTAETITVRAGDSLSSLAQDHLGDSGRWKEIYEASTSIEQPGGYRLSDPNQISVGWKLRVPAQEHAATAHHEEKAEKSASQTRQQADRKDEERETSADTAPVAADDAEQAAAAKDAPAQETPPVPADSAAPAQDTTTATDEENSISVPWAGVGAILAASILSAVAAHRLRTSRKRRAGRRIPEAATVDLDEVRLARIEEPNVLAFVDRALRTLAALQLHANETLPDVRLARLTDKHLELYAAAAHRLPEPFEATDDPAVWLLPRTANLADNETIADIVAPYPALVTIGNDHEDNQILVDLEYLAALGIHAGAKTSMPVMRALTVSLATSQWADDLAITTVGVCPELEGALGSGRISYRETVAELLDDLEAKLARDQEVLTELGQDSAQHARQAPDASDVWAPEIIIIGADLSITEKSRLQKIVGARPQIAVAVISSDQHTDLSEWRMHIESLEAARLEPIGLELSPQHLDDEDYERVLRALTNAQTTEAAGAKDTDEDRDDEADTQPPLRPLPIIQPTGSGILTTQQRDSEVEQSSTHPHIQILGPVEILGAKGPLEEKRLAELTETAAYIHLCPGKAVTDFQADLWPNKRPGKNSRPERVSRLRRWLGETTDGTKYLPRAAGADGGYTLTEDITSDWARFQEIAQRRTDASNEELAEALKLVRGRPFEDAGHTRYRWATLLQFRMTEAILDLAHELAQRALDAGDTDTALWATERGLRAESLYEQLWQDRLRAAAHDPELHRRITGELEAQIEGLDEGYDLEQKTEDLMYTTPTPHRIAI